MNEKVFATLKSAETEDWLDYHVVRPFCYLWACLFAKLGVHPNTVTVMSMFIGAASCVFFIHGSFFYEGVQGLIYNLIGILLLCFADVFDCTDGQLARMTDKKSRMGRILDGLAGFTWYTPIYVGLVYRFYLHHDFEFNLLGIAETPENALIATIVVLCIGLYSGFVGLEGQQRLADYYIQVHLFFLKGEKGSELDNSVRQQEIYEQTPWEGNLIWKSFLRSYVTYTKKQEAVTPKFQRMLAVMKEKFGSVDNIPSEVRKDFHAESLAIMPYNGMLTFNFRSLWLFLFVLIDFPVGNFLFEAIGMGLLCLYVNRRHEAFCERITNSIK